MITTFNMLLIHDTISILRDLIESQYERDIIFNNINDVVIGLSLANSYPEYELSLYELELADKVFTNPLEYDTINDTIVALSVRNSEFLSSDTCSNTITVEYQKFTRHMTKLYEGIIDNIEEMELNFDN